MAIPPPFRASEAAPALRVRGTVCGRGSPLVVRVSAPLEKVPPAVAPGFRRRWRASAAPLVYACK